MARKSYGRSLIELMVLLAILSILLTAALPNLHGMRENTRRSQSVNQMIALLHHARSSSVYARAVVTVCQGNTNCSGSQNWNGNILVFLDHNANGQMDANDILLYQSEIADEYRWRWNRSQGHIQFEADGSTRALNGTLTLCKSSTPQRQVVVSLSGRTRTQKASANADCGS